MSVVIFLPLVPPLVQRRYQQTLQIICDYRHNKMLYRTCNVLLHLGCNLFIPAGIFLDNQITWAETLLSALLPESCRKSLADTNQESCVLKHRH